MRLDIGAVVWPVSRMAEALQVLAQARALPLSQRDAPPTPTELANAPASVRNQWIELAATTLGLEVEHVEVSYEDVERFLRRAAPAVVLIRHNEVEGLLLLYSGGRRRVTAITPAHVRCRLPIAALCELIRSTSEARLVTETEQWFDEAQVVGARRARARAAILREHAATVVVTTAYLIRVPPDAPLTVQASASRLWLRLSLVVLAHLCSSLLWILSWWHIGRTALDGRADPNWLTAWLLMVATAVPLTILVTWLRGRFSIEVGVIFRQRLLLGTQRLELDDTKHDGSGRFLGRVIESQALESQALAAASAAVISGVELTLAAIISGIAAVWLPILHVAWMVIVALVAWRLWVARCSWADQRLTMTQDLVEHMAGHRTRAVQERRDTRHDEEDKLLGRYLKQSRLTDRWAVWLTTLPRGWLIAGTLSMTPLFLNDSSSVGIRAVALGCVLLSYRAFRQLVAGASYFCDAVIAWDRAGSIFRAAARMPPLSSPTIATRTDAPLAPHLIEAKSLTFSHRDRADPVLDGCSFDVSRGDRVLVHGPSGGGKSTLISLLAGIRSPASGLLLVDGADRSTHGAVQWRRKVAAVPQFHENHVFSGTVAFNLLMGSEWPPAREDLLRATAICHELGLGELIARMPRGLAQEVGESGWQLSHGERSRLFIARALLKNADVVVLDESFSQLDPETFSRTLSCVLSYSPTLMVVHHV